MREFVSAGPLGALPPPAKALYTAFAAFNLAGLGSAVVLYDGIVDFGATTPPAVLYERLVTHHTPPVDTTPAAAGEQRGLDRRALREVTHAHLFSMSVLLLVAGHLFLLTSATARVKCVLVAAGIAGVGLHLLSPWIIVWTEGRFGSALVYPITGALLLGSLGAMTALPVWEMWRPRARGAPSGQ